MLRNRLVADACSELVLRGVVKNQELRFFQFGSLFRAQMLRRLCRYLGCKDAVRFQPLFPIVESLISVVFKNTASLTDANERGVTAAHLHEQVKAFLRRTDIASVDVEVLVPSWLAAAAPRAPAPAVRSDSEEPVMPPSVRTCLARCCRDIDSKPPLSIPP